MYPTTQSTGWLGHLCNLFSALLPTTSTKPQYVPSRFSVDSDSDDSDEPLRRPLREVPLNRTSILEEIIPPPRDVPPYIPKNEASTATPKKVSRRSPSSTPNRTSKTPAKISRRSPGTLRQSLPSDSRRAVQFMGTLKPYQKQALARLIKQERNMRDPEGIPDWVHILNGQLLVFATGYVQGPGITSLSQLFPNRLGKTIVSIALVCHSVQNPDARGPTLYDIL